MGYESPMPVQEEVIPFLLGEDNDVIALAQTGTGKTAAYGLPILQKIYVPQYQPQALVLCPTRELCLQIADDLNDYSKYIEGLKVLPVLWRFEYRKPNQDAETRCAHCGSDARPIAGFDEPQNGTFGCHQERDSG